MTGPLQLEHFTETGGLRAAGRAIRTCRARGSRSPATSSAFPPSVCRCSARPRSRISSRSTPRRAARISPTFFSFPIPCVFITKNQEPTADLVELATNAGIARHSRRGSRRTSSIRASSRGSRTSSRPSTNLHGSLADVFGVGLLFVGSSGIGKSECVLDLVERGHRLVADDLVIVKRRLGDVLIGRGHELQRHHMEIRGVGLVDIPSIFGIRAVRQQKRIEVVVQLEIWDQDASHVDRTGLDTETKTILDVEIPKVRVPLNPGKNITVIAEVIAMNHLLKYSGIDPAERFNERLMQSDGAEVRRAALPFRRC